MNFINCPSRSTKKENVANKHEIADKSVNKLSNDVHFNPASKWIKKSKMRQERRVEIDGEHEPGENCRQTESIQIKLSHLVAFTEVFVLK